MQIGVFILGTLGFAAASAILYVWGYRKSRKTPRWLQAQMGRAIEERIQSFLAGQSGGATLKEIAKAIDDISVGSQLQGYKLQVEDAGAVAGAVLQHMVVKGIVAEAGQQKPPLYVLKSKE
jgi:hypothetical protein